LNIILKQINSWTAQDVRDDRYETAKYVVAVTLKNSGHFSKIDLSRNVEIIEQHEFVSTNR